MAETCVAMHEHKNFEGESPKRAFTYFYIDFFWEVAAWMCTANVGGNVALDC